MFTSVLGYSLVNHVIATHTVTCPIDCTWKCLRDARCQSFNYANSGKTCELSDQSKATAPNDFVLRKGITYYEPTTQMVSHRNLQISQKLNHQCSTCQAQEPLKSSVFQIPSSEQGGVKVVSRGQINASNLKLRAGMKTLI